MFVHQSEYAEKIFKKFGMLDAKSVCVPADPSIVLYPAEDENVCESVSYRETVGFLMFLAVVSRPDLAYAVNSVSKYLTGAVVVYSLEYSPVVHDVAGSIPANLMDSEWKTVSA